MEKLPVNNPDPVLSADCQALLDENRALKDKNQALQDEVQKLRERLEEPEELQRAISEGDLDALVMPVSEEDLMIFILNSADQAYRVLMETANEDIVILDANFKIVYVGERLLDKTGYKHEEVIGRPWLHFVDEEYKTFVEQRMEERKKGISDNYELKLIRRDHSSYWAITSAKPLFDENGKFRGALAMLTDITERKQADEALLQVYENLQEQSEELQVQSEELQMQNEELQSQSNELNEAYEALHEREEQYRMLFTNMTDAFYLTEVIYDKNDKPYDYRFLEVNPAYDTQIGVKREKLLGKTLMEVFPNTSVLAI